MPIRPNYGFDFPTCKSIITEPFSAADCAKYPTRQLLAVYLASTPHGATFRAGALWTGATPAQLATACALLIPIITSIVPASFLHGQPGLFVNGSNFTASGSLTLGNAPTWAGSTIKVTQTVTAWTSTKITFTAVQGGLPYSPGVCYAYVTNSLGLRNPDGFPCLFEAP